MHAKYWPNCKTIFVKVRYMRYSLCSIFLLVTHLLDPFILLLWSEKFFFRAAARLSPRTHLSPICKSPSPLSVVAPRSPRSYGFLLLFWGGFFWLFHFCGACSSKKNGCMRGNCFILDSLAMQRILDWRIFFLWILKDCFLSVSILGCC